MAERRRIWPKVALAIVVIVGGAYAVVKLDIWQAERRAQMDLELEGDLPEEPAAKPQPTFPSEPIIEDEQP